MQIAQSIDRYNFDKRGLLRIYAGVIGVFYPGEQATSYIYSPDSPTNCDTLYFSS